MQLMGSTKQRMVMEDDTPSAAVAPRAGGMTEGLLAGLGGLTDAMKSKTRGLKDFSIGVISDISGTVGAKPTSQAGQV